LGDKRWPEANVRLVAGRKKKKTKTQMKGEMEARSALKQRTHNKTANMTKRDKDTVTDVTAKSC
jgi:hypothetical protein